MVISLSALVLASLLSFGKPSEITQFSSSQCNRDSNSPNARKENEILDRDEWAAMDSVNRERVEEAARLEGLTLEQALEKEEGIPLPILNFFIICLPAIVFTFHLYISRYTSYYVLGRRNGLEISLKAYLPVDWSSDQFQIISFRSFPSMNLYINFFIKSNLCPVALQSYWN